VRALPEELDDRDLVDALRDGWGLDPASIVYEPVGGGSYHWRVEDNAGATHWVTVDDLEHKQYLGDTRDAAFDALRRAFEAATRARAGGLEFVVAPVPSRGGPTVVRVGGRHAVAVFPYLAKPSGQWGESRTAAERGAVVDALVRLHRALPGAARTYRPEVPHRAELDRALAELDRPWTGGPYSERVRNRLTRYAPAVRKQLARFDRLSEQVRASAAAPVLTHGEPHPGNVVFGEGCVRLVDWDTAAIALPERDLWMLDTSDDMARGDLARYAEASGRPVDPAAIELYRLRWKLDDIASFVHLLRSPHTDNADTAISWRWAVDTLESDRVWPYQRSVDST
jgi:spectinomycin phosphotransferase